jgi:hypothetical protein
MKLLEETLYKVLEQRLHSWADWYSRGNKAAIGYPPVSIMYWACYQTAKEKARRQAPSLPNHVEAEQVEQQVYELAQNCPLLAKALRCQYFTLGTLQYKAEQLQLSISQFKHYVDMAKIWIAARLSSSKQHKLS